MSLPRNSAVRKINELVKRARLAKVHAFITSHLRNEMPYFGRAAKQEVLFTRGKEGGDIDCVRVCVCMCVCSISHVSVCLCVFVAQTSVCPISRSPILSQCRLSSKTLSLSSVRFSASTIFLPAIFPTVFAFRRICAILTFQNFPSWTQRSWRYANC